VIRGVATVVLVASTIAAVAMVGTATAKAAASPFVSCHGPSGVLCSTVTVPLDWSGVVPGTLPLAVEELPAKGTPRGVMMLLAGGPGQASALAFDLADLGALWQSYFPDYTLVTFDPRGTGNSGFLGCSIDSNALVLGAEVAACGNALGPARAYYTTAANAEDVEAIRQALGVDKVALWGTSYGTKVELAYALAHPDHVERLLLDSVVPTAGPDPLALDMLQGIPRGLSALCGNAACRAIAPDLAGELATLANRAATVPIRGSVRSAAGTHVPVVLDGPTLLGIAVSADLSPGLQAELPSAVTGAVAGRPQQLLRLAEFAQGGGFATTNTSFSEGLFLATMCDDGRFPWAPDAALPDRQQALDAAVAALPAGATGPFGTWATVIGTATYCLSWPSPSGNAPLAAGPLPDVPVLALSGALDMRTPTSNAASVLSQFPQGHLLVVPGVGHSVLTTDPSGCAASAVRTWLAGGTVPTRCTPARRYLADVGKIPASVAAAPPSHGITGLRGRTLSVVQATVQDAFAASVTAGTSVGGLVGGKVTGNLGSLNLVGYSDVTGLTVSGTLYVKDASSGPVYTTDGSVTVSGAKAAHGVVTFVNGRVKVSWSRSS
jgi:pimeloyl-ACP methyl ester carboxylesterase